MRSAIGSQLVPCSAETPSTLTVEVPAPLILAGLCAEGETTVSDEGGHIARGYAGIEEKLRAVGGRVTRVEE